MSKIKDNKLIIFDTTLRDGEQSPGASMTQEEKVFIFISKQTQVPVEQIKLDSLVEQDFSLASLDTIVFYEEFFKEFNIQNSQDFNSDKYITSAPTKISVLFKSIFDKDFRQKLKYEDVTVRHLIKIAQNKNWEEI